MPTESVGLGSFRVFFGGAAPKPRPEGFGPRTPLWLARRQGARPEGFAPGLPLWLGPPSRCPAGGFAPDFFSGCARRNSARRRVLPPDLLLVGAVNAFAQPTGCPVEVDCLRPDSRY